MLMVSWSYNYWRSSCKFTYHLHEFIINSAILKIKIISYITSYDYCINIFIKQHSIEIVCYWSDWIDIYLYFSPVSQNNSPYIFIFWRRISQQNLNPTFNRHTRIFFCIFIPTIHRVIKNFIKINAVDLTLVYINYKSSRLLRSLNSLS